MQVQKQLQVEKHSSIVFYLFFKRCFDQCGISTLQLAVFGNVLAGQVFQ